MSIDGRVQYVLVDTPGFQRARRAMAWLRQRGGTAAERPSLVEAFVATHRDRGDFPDEVELLTPVLAGAGILYVVDGSVPFSSEYEDEMEILRWTGQPSMALINPIASQAHVAEWEAALHQYFKIVRVFNAVTAEFDKRIELLRAFGQMRDAWRGPLQRSVQALLEDRERRHRQAARAIAHAVVDMMSLTVSEPIAEQDDPGALKRRLEARYLQALRQREQEARVTVESAYAHHRLERLETQVTVTEADLFAAEQWRLFGLSRGQLALVGAAGGAATGAAIDVSTGGHTFLTGTLIGGGVGAVLALAGGGKVAEVRGEGVLDRLPGGRWLRHLPGMNRPLGGRELRIGPCRNVNFAYVVLGRAMHHADRVARRTHADRGALRLDDTDRPRWHERLPAPNQDRLRKLLSQLARGDADAVVLNLTSLLAEALRGDEPRADSPEHK